MLIPAPYWVSYPEMARLAGATPRVLGCSAREGYLLTPAQLRGALTPASRLLILCTPSNPTGAVYPLARLQVGSFSVTSGHVLPAVTLRPGKGGHSLRRELRQAVVASSLPAHPVGLCASELMTCAVLPSVEQYIPSIAGH